MEKEKNMTLMEILNMKDDYQNGYIIGKGKLYYKNGNIKYEGGFDYS